MQLLGVVARLVRGLVYLFGMLWAGFPVLAHAATEVGGGVVADTVWSAANSPYLVTSPVTVASGATLSIEAGVVVHMAAGTDLTVDTGALQVKGTAAAPVRITSYRLLAAQAGAPGDWGKVRFNAGTIKAKTLLENLTVEYGEGIILAAAAPTFNNVAVNFQSGPAMSIDLASSPQGSGNSATGNTINGIVVPAGELQTSVQWAMRGIPFVLSQGTFSIGQSPALNSVTPASFEQGEQASVNLGGRRLKGFEQLRFEPPIPGATILAGATDTSVGLGINVPVTMPVGPVAIRATTDAGEVSLADAFRITAMQAPTIASVTPRAVARNAETTVLLNGNSLSAATVASATPGLQLLGVNATRSSLSFRVKVDGQVVPAVYPLTLSNAAGQAEFSIEVIPEVAPPPPFSVIPTLVTLAPDSVYRSILFSAAQSAVQDRNYTLVIDDLTVARLRTAAVTLPAGQVSVPIAIAGLKVGTTVLRISGDGLAQPLEAPVSVVAGGYQQTSIAPMVGIVRGEQFTGGGTNRALISSPVGLVIGNGNTTNVANYKVIGSPVGLVKGNLYGGTSFVVSPSVGLMRQ